ncbi:hypothetical protein C8F04DRAFT_1341092 [Mycena alexandri]|uniref:Uncharacterized protein n=1 Tax=Mycena alexandri TaxID=1745969 RepID=A0AAD6SYS7_9AGAR|nr:hypothetical protein C8F04DRAFT_1341092 [Mycena alexandri]
MDPTTFAASRTSLSGSSLYTTTSSSTQWGPGAVAGKAIRAMGKAVVRGAEYFVISRRLSGIKAAMPCSDDEKRPNVQQMFFDVLELSRPRLYPEAFRTQAMQILLAQIASKQTRYLRACIAELEIDHGELVALLSEMIGVVLFPKRGFVDKRLTASYTMALPSDCHPWAPYISFMSGVAGLNEATFHAVLDARFLEVILWVSGVQIHQRKIDSALENECGVAFKLLSEPPSFDLSLIWVEQLLRLCPDTLVASVPDAVNSITGQLLWPIVECRLLEMHVGGILRLMHPANYHDLDLGSSESAFASLGGNVHHETVEHLSRLSYPKRIGTLSQMIQHLIAQSYVEGGHAVDLTPILFTSEHRDMARNIVRFLVDIAKTGQVPFAEENLLDAALFNISPFLSAEWDPSGVYGDIYRRIYFSRSLGRKRSMSSYSDHTSDLLSAIRTSGLWTVVDEPSRMRSWVQFLQPLF